MSHQLSLLDQERQQQPEKTDAQRIADIAARVIDELQIEPPIDLNVVASFRDIATIAVMPMQQAGSLAPRPSGLVMSLRASDSLRRRRFTGFHEIGHTFQPGYTEQTLFRCAAPSVSPRSASDPESLADVAAAELLLPHAFFGPATRESDFAMSSIIDLSDTYEASVQATTYRFAAFWPEPTLVVVLEPGLRKEERDDPEAMSKLRVVSAWPCPYGAWPYVPANKSADQNGALVRALNGEVIRERAGLEELGLESPDDLELAARVFTYSDGTKLRKRVVALFRRVGKAHG